MKSTRGKIKGHASSAGIGPGSFEESEGNNEQKRFLGNPQSDNASDM